MSNNFSCGCMLPKNTKEPTFKASKYFEDLSASFAINTKQEQLTAHYSWLVQLRRDLPTTSIPYIEATLEHPSRRSEPLVVPAMELAQTDPHAAPFPSRRFYVLSPALAGVQCGLYSMRLTAYADRSKTKVLATHENEILSRVNTETCFRDEFMRAMGEMEKSQGWEEADKRKNGKK
ncbi:hypothetical protein BC936DRAFT_141009 [Jimgerdemannia flammicorona]|nr:hypothetical protein BC936DRAFT_141009 [Jimgerdemannia flammicorona]